MQKQLKDKFPQWCKDTTKGKYNLYITNDADALLSGSYNKQLHNYEVTRMFDFKSIYATESNEGKEFIGVDMALEHGKVWDNHITRLTRMDIANPESANVNTVSDINRKNYRTKYAGSTVLQIMSYYNIPLPKSREGKLVLLTIDSSFKGFYNSDFRDICISWLQQLELYDLIDSLHDTKENEFKRVKQQYNLGSEIRVDENGKLQTEMNLAAMQSVLDIPLSLSEEKFTKTHTFETTGKWTMDKDAKNSKHEIDELYSIALTSSNTFKYSRGIREI